MKGILGYGRYDDDPDCVGCPRAASDMTPCIARDGHLALDDSGTCVGCSAEPEPLLRELVLATDRTVGDRNTAEGLADALAGLVREVTEPHTPKPAE